MPNDPRVEKMRRWGLAFNKKDLDALDQLADEIYTPDVVGHDPDMPNAETGLTALKKWIRVIMGRNPDMHMDVDDFFVDGDYVITRATLKANDQTSGKPNDLVMLAIDRYVGDKIAEGWSIVVPGKW